MVCEQAASWKTGVDSVNQNPPLSSPPSSLPRSFLEKDTCMNELEFLALFILYFCMGSSGVNTVAKSEANSGADFV